VSTKKILLIIGGIVIVLGLIVVLFAGGITFVVFRTISNSEAADAARAYLKNNEKLKQDIGEVKDFGWLVTGNINFSNGDGVATLYLTAKGEKGDADTRVDLQYRNSRAWRVTGASYTRNGQNIDLMGAYGPPSANSP
jgi:flagellar basal body-associated protein FliL